MTFRMAYFVLVVSLGVDPTVGESRHPHQRPSWDLWGRSRGKLRHEREDDVKDYVSAGEIWNKGQMMKMLGFQENEKWDNEDLFDHKGESKEVPSLLSDLFNKINEPGTNIVPLKCRIPEMKGNVVRMMNSKGRTFYQDDHHTIIELQFSIKNALHEYENVTEAHLKVLAPGVRDKDRELFTLLTNSGLMAIPQYTYQIYHADDFRMERIRSAMNKLRESRNFIIPEGGTRALTEYIKNLIGKPVSTEIYAQTFYQNTQKIALNIKPLVQKWRNTFFKKARLTFGRGILVVTTETDSSVTKQCIRPVLSNPKLLLVSLDKRHCPMPAKSYIAGDVTMKDDVLLERHKRDVRVSKDEKKRKQMRKERRKSKPKHEYIYGGVIEEEGKKSRKSQSVPPRQQSRRTRSTICRRYPMYVTFDDVGWGSWIIAPRGYQAYRCAGECPFPLGGKLGGTNHAVLATMMHSVDPWSTPQPCCVPTALKPVSLLYFATDGSVVLRQYEDMVVGTCGCR